MFPIIPQYLVSKTNADLITDYNETTLLPTHESKTSPSFGDTDVAASSEIERNLESENIEIGEILSSKWKANSVEKVRIFSQGNKIRCNTSNWSWLRRVHLAEDCHSYNLELDISPTKSHLQIKATRRILPEERLIFWFSRDLIAILQIPYLTLNNIRVGERQYICHKCQFQCEMPNPLKIHLSLDCGRLSRRDLWNRLQQNDSPSINVTTLANFTVSDKPVSENEKTQSAFKPYIKSSPAKICSELDKRLTRPTLPKTLEDQKVMGFSQSMLYKQAVEMEDFASHMGRIKQGHLCIYCGKIYSRKYGLKIHIRTHTGFKPLKCKFCERPFGDPSNLNKHVRLHSEGDTPYKCDLCSKILVRKRDLDRHMKSRH